MARILLSAHDAGGAQVVACWAAHHPEDEYAVLAAGPAVAIFEARLPGATALDPGAVDEAVAGCDRVVTATSWASGLERRVIRAAREAGRFVAAYLDHWSNYAERFRDAGGDVQPDEIWVGDDYALEIASATFERSPCKLVPNGYFDELRDELARLSRASDPPDAGEHRILYVCEPIEEHCRLQFGDSRHWGYTEFEALEYFLGVVDGLTRGSEAARLRVRPHPSEAPEKYDAILAAHGGGRAARSAGTSLEEDCVWARTVVGCDSMAMVVALLAGKQVFSAIPPGGRAMSLPHREIRYLRDLDPSSPR